MEKWGVSGSGRADGHPDPLSLWERVGVRVPRPSRPHPPLRVGLSPRERRGDGFPSVIPDPDRESR